MNKRSHEEGEGLSGLREEAARRRLRDVVKRARRLSDWTPEETLEEGLAMIDSVHSIEVQRV